MKALSGNKPVTLDNDTCPYCGGSLPSSSREKDHVIARRFVPTGKLSGSWNLKVRCCRKCNLEKSDLEDDISAITMKLLVDHPGRGVVLGEELARAIERKVRHSKSRLTKKPVYESYGNLEVRSSLAPGVDLTVNFAHPPQIAPERSFKLAHMQVMAFFYLITYNEETKRGRLWPGRFFSIPESEATRSDWGNPIHRWFMDAVLNWHQRVCVSTAYDFFKIAIRKHPEAACWSWALEWNRVYRLFGFFGEQTMARATAESMPPIEAEPIVGRGSDEQLLIRADTALDEKDDSMFLVMNKGS